MFASLTCVSCAVWPQTRGAVAGSVETPTERGFNAIIVMTINRVERNERLVWKRYSVFLESRGLRRGQAGI